MLKYLKTVSKNKVKSDVFRNKMYLEINYNQLSLQYKNYALGKS